MGFSPASRVRCGKGSTYKISIDPDTQLPCFRRLVVCRSFHVWSLGRLLRWLRLHDYRQRLDDFERDIEDWSRLGRSWRQASRMNLALRRREEVRNGKVAMVPGDEALEARQS